MSKEHKTLPTTKQKRAVVNYIENHGNASKAMRDAGYTEATAKNPSNLTKSKAFLALMEEYFPNELLFKEHKKNIVQDKDKGAKNTAITSAYKLKDLYPKDQTDIDAGDLIITVKKA